MTGITYAIIACYIDKGMKSKGSKCLMEFNKKKLLDYQTTDYGIKMPFKQDQGQMMMVTKKITINPSIDATIFNGN